MRKSFITDYEQAFILFSTRVERFVLYTLISLAIMVVAAQITLQFASMRSIFTKVDPLEGQPFFSDEQQHK